MQCWTMFSTAEHTQVNEISVVGHLVSALSATAIAGFQCHAIQNRSK